MARLKHIILALFISIFIFNELNANQLDRLIQGSFEEVEKTLFILDKIFNENEDRFLDKITIDTFITSERYFLLKDYARTSKINFNHRSEICKKEFILNNNEKNSLIIVFEKNIKTKIWLIVDAYILKKNKRVEFKSKGFSPLSITNNFQDLLRKLHTPALSTYLGLAKHGKLNKKFFQDNRVNLSKNSELLLKDIIIYNNKTINAIIYIKLKYFPIGREENNQYKGGWLLVDAGSMSNYYKKDLYINFLLNRLDPNTLKLDQPNEFIYTTNLRELIKNKPNKQNNEQNKQNKLYLNKYKLYIKSNVNNPTIRIMNIKPKFKQGILLAPGNYLIEVSKSGYITRNKWVKITNTNSSIRINLYRY